MWPIINDTTKEFNSIILCSNNFDDFNFNKNLTLLTYEQGQNYTKRLISILRQVGSEYVLLSHDVDLILNFNFSRLEIYMKIIEENKIDRLSLGVFDNPSQQIEYEGLTVCKLHRNLGRNFFTPFDNSPAIYDREKLIRFYECFSDETYNSLEQNENAQQYFLKNMNCYGIQKNDNIKLIYHRGLVYSYDFNFLHITVAGKFLSKESYFDLMNDFERIKFTYRLYDIASTDSKDLQKNEI